MNLYRAPASWSVAVAFTTAMAAAISPAAEPLRLAHTIPLPGVEGRIDHIAIDMDGQRLFVAALGNNTLEVVDLATGKVVRSVSGLHEPQGVVFLKDRGQVAVANGDDGTCVFLDANSFRPSETIDFQQDADNVRYDPANQRLYVGFGKGAIGAIDMIERKRLADVKLPGHPESFQLETNGPRIFVNVPTARQIVVIDRKQSVVILTWPVVQAEANFPMSLDEEHHRLFVGCRAPAEVLVYDTQTGTLASRFPSVGDADDLFYDSQTRRLYVSGGEGFITVYQQQDANHYSQLAKISTAAGARTALFVPSSARLYLAVPHRGSQASELRVYEVVP